MINHKVYVVIVNYGAWQDTMECLNSILTNEHQNYKVLIVDVANKNNSVKELKKYLDNIEDKRFELLYTPDNKGFAFANNIGIKHAQKQEDCKFIWILNNDTVILKNSIDELIKCYEQNKNTKSTGFIGSKILDYKKRELIQNVGGTFNKWTGYSILLGMGEKDTGQFDNKKLKVDYVIGASMFFHKSLIGEIGLMPEKYFLYYEDIDWCISAQKAGFKNSTCIKSLIYHKQGISTGVKLLTKDDHLKNKKHLYLSYLKFYQSHYKILLPVAYFILIKQMAGKMFHNNLQEAKLILQVISKKS